jgi:hypothetical protein
MVAIHLGVESNICIPEAVYQPAPEEVASFGGEGGLGEEGPPEEVVLGEEAGLWEEGPPEEVVLGEEAGLWEEGPPEEVALGKEAGLGEEGPQELGKGDPEELGDPGEALALVANLANLVANFDSWHLEVARGNYHSNYHSNNN